MRKAVKALDRPVKRTVSALSLPLDIFPFFSYVYKTVFAHSNFA